ncbi:MAG: cobalamin biosynthesis protein, partial [Tannerellaceae bacterium]|jgi:adenosylcobinamide-phosphate synthase|nr:cobalamin biosynthesis protein [Tannerellaceae bacterium]
VLLSGKPSLFAFVRRYGRQHASPNSGYPEAALAGVLDCRFGGANSYFGVRVDKPYIGNNPRNLTSRDLKIALALNRKVEACTVAFVISYLLII